MCYVLFKEPIKISTQKINKAFGISSNGINRQPIVAMNSICFRINFYKSEREPLGIQ